MVINLENFQQLSVVITARDHNPNILTVDFLKGSGVIPSDWEPARPAVLSSQGTRILFKNGLDIVGQRGKVTFSEPTSSKGLDELVLADVAQKYAEALPNLDYRAVGINPRRFVTFDEQDDAHTYMTAHILKPGAWQAFGAAPMQAGVNLVYTLEKSQLRLAINEARLKAPDQEVPAVVFGGTFRYALADELSATERLQALREAVAQWRADYNSFQDLIDQQFLADIELPSGSGAELYGMAS